MNMSEYARLRQCSPEAVRKAILSGRLVRAVKQENGKTKIDPFIAQEEWALNTNAAMQTHKRPDATDSGSDMPTTPRGVSPSSPSLLNRSREINEAFKAKHAELNYNKAIGKLVDVDAVNNDAFRIGRFIRDGLMSLPNRLAPEFAGMNDIGAIQRRMEDEIRETLQALKREAEQEMTPPLPHNEPEPAHV